MAVQLRPGNRFRSAVCTTEIVVVRAGDAMIDLRCGGQPVVAIGASPPEGLTLVAGFATGTLLGKRYTDADATFELLCTKAGAGVLAVGDEALQQSGAKPLPASD